MSSADRLGIGLSSTTAFVERALGELRSGRPVLLQSQDEDALVLGAEAFDAEAADAFAFLEASGPARLVLPAPRLVRLGAPRAADGSLALPAFDAARVEMLALGLDARLDAPVSCAGPADLAALELLALALVLPAAVVLPVLRAAVPCAVAVRADDVVQFRRAQAASLRVVGRAKVPLEGAQDCEFVVFRGGEGLRDQVAVVVGRPDPARPVAVRLHSACLTGDLFGSLKCDCGDQLRDTVVRMAAEDGGILLYLDQEGRGNGIANKMRAYDLQSQGFDTYDADAALGFGLDQRRFEFAAEMLRQLGVSTVRLHTNNPLKVAALKAAGLDVVAEQRVLGRPTLENVRYLASKRDRAGHAIDFEQLAARAPD
ncbi:GTP cyclohydrolase II RibA [Xanthobacter sp. KR7-225]|uniref:GTP cyclohydrolase II RibA n=1 Tax=Xanthobacter sp. KR7-225 TaxID=3156613 RepID=UPI0032B59E37